MLNLKKHTGTNPKPKPTLVFKNCSCVCVYHCIACTIVVHNKAQNSSDNFPSYPPIIIAQMMPTGGEGDVKCQNVPAVAADWHIQDSQL